MSATSGVVLLSAAEQRRLQRDNAQLQHSKNVLKRDMKSMKEEHEAFVRRLIRIGREEHHAVMVQAESDVARITDEHEELVEQLRAELREERMARERQQRENERLRATEERMKKELNQLKSSKATRRSGTAAS
ncbi:unnamed protein product [Peniophora sp. CBMAI 1063]|nr:unnamed protein product [Peniophora sp. CBMAI 1063]